jgi:hypothetical protein
MLMAHIYEALSIIEDIQQDTKLRAAVQQCEAKTRSSFDAVAAFLGTDDYEMLLRIRNNAYLETRSENSLESRASILSFIHSGAQRPWQLIPL